MNLTFLSIAFSILGVHGPPDPSLAPPDLPHNAPLAPTYHHPRNATLAMVFGYVPNVPSLTLSIVVYQRLLNSSAWSSLGVSLEQPLLMCQASTQQKHEAYPTVVLLVPLKAIQSAMVFGYVPLLSLHLHNFKPWNNIASLPGASRQATRSNPGTHKQNGACPEVEALVGNNS